jgi:hypothetical protein
MENTKTVVNHRGRPRKHNTPYTGGILQQEATFEEYLDCVADCFGEPYDDRENRTDDAPSLRSVCDEFGISIPKARKLLITAGVYSTEQSRRVVDLAAQGKSIEEIGLLTGLKRSSVSSYLPYKKYSYKMDEMSDTVELSRHAEDSRKYRERKKAVDELHEAIVKERVKKNIDTDAILWQAVIAYQGYPFHTSSGLSFSYTVKKNKESVYTGELEISRKEESKTLTKSSVLLAFHTVLEAMEIVLSKDGEIEADCETTTTLITPEYKGPKAIGQIFGISYVYSLFWKLGLIRVPGKVEDKLRGKKG